MRDLHVVSVSEDGRHVLLAARRNAGTGQFRVALDERLTAALRGELVRPVQSAAVPVPVTPKQIQARLRAGESSEQIAASAGVPVARIERFAGPVLSEREGMIRGAQAAVLDRSKKGRSQLPLGEAVQQHLAGTPGYKPDSAVWTARREESGVWLVQLTYVARARRRTASWRYDPVNRQVSALDGSSATLAHIDPAAGVRVAARPSAPSRAARSNAHPSALTESAPAARRRAAPDEAARRRIAAAQVALADALAEAAEPQAGPTRRRAMAAGAASPAASAKGAPRDAVAAPALTRVTRPAKPAVAPAARAVPGIRKKVAPVAPAAAPGRPAAAPRTQTAKPVTAKSVTAKPLTAKSVTAKAVRPKPVTAKPVTVKPVTVPFAVPAPPERSGPPTLRVVPPAAEPPGQPAQPVRPPAPAAAEAEALPPQAVPARRAAGGRASVPAWADVLLGTGPRERPAPPAPPAD